MEDRRDSPQAQTQAGAQSAIGLRAARVSENFTQCLAAFSSSNEKTAELRRSFDLARVLLH
jgi:hypothetical protein